MERGVNSHHPANASLERSFPDVHTSTNYQKRNEFVNDLGILEDALVIGRDYLEIAGKVPTVSNFQALYFNKYIGYEPSEIERIFSSWEVFQTDVRIEHDLFQKKQQEKKQEILKIIDLDRQIGALHPRLFNNTVLSKTFEQQAKEDHGGKSRWNLHLFLDTEVGEDEKITRYIRFKIAENLTPNLDEENTKTSVDPLSRRSSIALGFNIDTGLVLSSYVAEILKSNSMLNMSEVDYEIEDVARSHGWLDYLCPEARSRDLSKLKEVAEKWGQYPAPEKSYYDIRRAKLLGKVSLKTYMSSSEKPEHIRPLVDLLTDEALEARNNSVKAFEYKNRTEEDDIAYGRWMLGVLQPSGRTLTARIIRRASQLNLGPSPEYLAITHGSLIKFYEKIGATLINAKGVYDSWDDEKIINHIKAVAAENGGKVTASILLSRIEEGRNEPRPSYLKKRYGNLRKLFEAAGFSTANRKLSADDCLDSAISFMQSTGKSHITRKDCRESGKLPSDYVIIRLFGSVENLNEAIAEHLEEKIAA